MYVVSSEGSGSTTVTGTIDIGTVKFYADATGGSNAATSRGDIQAAKSLAGSAELGSAAAREGKAAFSIASMTRTAKTADKNANAGGTIAGAFAKLDATTHGAVSIGNAVYSADSVSGHVDASGRVIGARSDEGHAKVGSQTEESPTALSIGVLTRTATTVSGASADAYGSIYGALAQNDNRSTGSAITYGAVIVDSATFSATSSDFAKASGDVYAARAEVGGKTEAGSKSAGSTILAIGTLSRTATNNSSSGTSAVEAAGNIAGAFSGSASSGGTGSATANGMVKIDSATFTAITKGKNVADAQGHVYGAFSSGGEANAGSTADGSKTLAIGTLSRSATVESSAGTLADANGRIAGAYGAGAVTAHGMVSIDSATFTATTKGTSSAAADGDVYSAFSKYGEVKAGSTTAGSMTLSIGTLSRTADSSGTSASAGGNIAGAYADTTGSATAYGTVKIDKATFAATTTGTNNAQAGGQIYGAFSGLDEANAGSTDAGSTTLAIDTLSRTATTDSPSSSAYARAAGNIAGAYTLSSSSASSVQGGDATAHGAVRIGTATFTATSNNAASTNSETETKGDVGGAFSDVGNAKAASLSVTSVTRTAKTNGGNASAYGRVMGASAGRGDSTDGTVTLGGNANIQGATSIGTVAFSATSAQAEADASGDVGGAFSALGNAVAGDAVTVTKASFSATGATGADASGDAAGAYSGDGDATVSGPVAIAVSRAAASSGGAADAANRVYGVRAFGDAVLGGDVTLSAASTATGANARQFAFAAGAVGQGSIDVLESASSISVTADTYAFGIATVDVQDPEDNVWNPNAAHVTTVRGPVAIVAATTGGGANDYVTHDANSREARPVRSAEYLGLGSDDTLNLNLGSGAVMDNGGAAFRVFGAEAVNLNSGTLSLAEDSYIINQRDFNAADGLTFGTVNAAVDAARDSVVTVGNSAALRIDGAVLSEITTSSGAHTSLFSTADASGASTERGFWLDQDYTLTLRTAGSGEVIVGSSGSMAASEIDIAKGGTLAYEVTAGATPDVIAAGTLHATGDATLTSPIDVRVSDVFKMDEGAVLSQALLTAGGTIRGFEENADSGLFYGYSLVDRGADGIWLDFARTANSIADVAESAGANGNVLDLANALDTFDWSGSFLDPFMTKLADMKDAGKVENAIRQLTGENGATGVMAGHEAHRNLLGLNAQFLFGSFANLSKDTVSVSQLNGGQDGLASLLCESPVSAWRLRGVASYSRLNLSGSDGFSRYRSTNRTLMLAAEHSRGGLSLGLAAGLGRTKTRAQDFRSRTDSDDYGVIAYGRYDFDQLFVAARFGFSRSGIDSDRRIPIMNERADGKYSARYLSAGLHFGHDFDFRNGMGLTLTGGGAWQKSIARAFRERGSDFALAYSSWNSDSFELQADATLSKKFDICRANGTHFTPRVSVGVGYELADRGVGGTTSFANLPGFPTFRSEGSRVGRFKGTVGAGFDWQMIRNLGLTAEYVGSFRRRAVEHGGRVGVSWTW